MLQKGYFRQAPRSNHRDDVKFISTQQDAMSYQPIENYGIIGNMRTVALVGMDGSIDWYCCPHFDSPSVFGAILDDKKGGRFQISAGPDGVRHKQFYWPSTNVLVTRFLLPDGIVELEDFMPAGLPSDSLEYHRIYRRVRCVRGAVCTWSRAVRLLIMDASSSGLSKS